MKSVNESKEHRYISYFQSVLTIGIMSNAKNVKEAEEKAKAKIKDKNGVNYCVFDQTDFELSDTEEWKPEFETESALEGVAFKFNPDDNTKNIIATRLGKELNDLTDTDYEDFIKGSIEKALKN